MSEKEFKKYRDKRDNSIVEAKKEMIVFERWQFYPPMWLTENYDWIIKSIWGTGYTTNKEFKEIYKEL